MRTLPVLVAAAACLLPSVCGATRGSVTGGVVDGVRVAAMTSAGTSASGAQDLLALADGVVWSLDSNDYIVRSTDSGALWRPVFPTWKSTATSLQLTGAFFLNSDDAWGVTAHEWPAQPGVTTIWRTTDGGVTWRQGRSLPGMLTDYGSLVDQLDFADSEHGFAFSVSGSTRSDALWATSDGGMNWRSLPSPTSLGRAVRSLSEVAGGALQRTPSP